MARAPRSATEHRTLAARVAWLAAVALTLLVPFVWDGDSFDPFRGTQGTLALALMAILAICFAVRAPRAAWRDPWMLPWAGALVGAIVSAAGSGEPIRVLFNTVFVALAALAWGALRQLDPLRRERLATLVVVAGSLQAAATIAFLFAALRPQSLAFIASAPSRERWIGTLGNPGDIGVFLVLPALAAAELAFSNQRRRWPMAAAAALMLGVALGTRTISALAALTVGVAVLLWRRVSGRVRVTAFAVAVAMLAAILFATPIGYRLRWLPWQMAEGGWMWLGSGRGAGYAAAAGMIASHPLTGVGFGLFGAHSFAYQSEAVLAARAKSLGLVTGFADTHNDLLQHAAETGVLGVLLLAAGVVLAIRRRARETDAPLPWPALTAAAVVVVLVQFPLHIDVIAAQWLIIAALVTPALPHAPVAAGMRRRALDAAVLAAVALAAFIAWQHQRALVALQQGRALTTTLQNLPDQRVASEVSRRARQNLAGRSLWLPYSYDLQVTLGSLAMTGRDYAEALARFQDALALADRPEIRFDVGMALVASGRRDEGLDEIEKAVVLNPRVLRELDNPDLREALRARLQASGYAKRYPWIWDPPPGRRKR